MSETNKEPSFTCDTGDTHEPPESSAGKPSDNTEALAHSLQHSRKLVAFLTESVPGIKGDAIIERMARYVAPERPDDILKCADQFTDLPFAEELLTDAAKKSPETALKHAKSYTSLPYADGIIETSVRAAASSPEQCGAVFTYCDIFADKPFAEECMLKALQVCPKDSRVPSLAVSKVGQYAGQPWAKEIVIAAFERNGWAPFCYLKSFVDLPFAKDVLAVCAESFPWAALSKPYLSVYADKPWAEEVILAAINGSRFEKKDFRNETFDIVIKKPYAERVMNALVKKYPAFILRSHRIMYIGTWGKQVMKKAVECAATEDPAEVLEAHPIKTSCSFSTSWLPKDLMSPEEWDTIFDTAIQKWAQQNPSSVFWRLALCADKPYARNIAIDAASRAPAGALQFIDGVRQQPPAYADEMLETAIRSALATEPALIVKNIQLIASCGCAEEVLLRVAEDPALAAELLAAMPKYRSQPWATRVAQKAVASVGSSAPDTPEAPATATAG